MYVPTYWAPVACIGDGDQDLHMPGTLSTTDLHPGSVAQANLEPVIILPQLGLDMCSSLSDSRESEAWETAVTPGSTG